MRSLWTPRSPEPLPAVLAGAGFFFFLAAVTGLGPFSSLDQLLWRAAQPGEAQALAQTAVRVRGSAQALSGAARVEALARDVAWLRAHGAGAIVLEAWLDEAPQAEARALETALRTRFEALPSGAKRAALKALSETAGGLDAPERLAAALGASQPLLLAYEAVPGSGAGLPEALKRQGYEVTLRGQRQRLPVHQALHLPYDAALEAVARAGAVPSDSGENGRLNAVLEMDGRWVNTLGLEAARLALGLPLEGLRYRWKQGVLSSLELKGTRYPLDEQGRLRVPDRLPGLAEVDLGRLRSDDVELKRLQGKAVFFRPWPKQLGDASAFEDQARLFAALVERNVLTPPAGPARLLAWALAWALAVAALAFAPGWAACLLWAALPVYAFSGFNQDLQSLAQPLVLALSAGLLGWGWRLQRHKALRTAAERLLTGKTAPGHQLAWRKRLSLSSGTLDAAYAVAGPRGSLRGAEWEAWMERWGAFMDERAAGEGVGLVFAGAKAALHAAEALIDLRQAIAGSASALAVGTLSYQRGHHLGAVSWHLSGPTKDQALELFKLAKPRQTLLLEADYPTLRDRVQIQVLGQRFAPKNDEDDSQVLNLLGITAKM